MSANFTTREQVTPEWAEAVAEALLRCGWAWRAGAGSTIEIQSERYGWMPLHLPGGSAHFDTKRTRDIALAAVQDALTRAHRADMERAAREGRGDGCDPCMAEIRALPIGGCWGAYFKHADGVMRLWRPDGCTDAFRVGRDAFGLGRDYSGNPYAPGSLAYVEWSQGFLAGERGVFPRENLSLDA